MNEQRETIMKQFRQMHRLHRQVIEKAIDPTILYGGQHRLLMVIFDHPLASQKDLAECMEVSTAAIATALKKLEKKGYVCKNVCSNDNRFNKIELTEEGLAIVKESKHIFKGLDECIFEGFTEEELMKLWELLNKLNTNLAQLNQKEEEEGKL